MDGLFLRDLELFTLAAGLRPLAKKEGLHADLLAAQADRLAAEGISILRAGTGAAYAGRDPEALRRAVELDETEVSSREPGRRRAAILELGRLLGYPPCCARAFANLERQDDEHVAAALLGPEPPERLPWELQFLPPVDSLVLHYPCSLDCAASLDLARRTLAALEAESPGSAARRRDALARIVVASGRFEFLVADTGVREKDRLQYRGLRSARDFHPQVPVAPAFEAFAQGLPTEGVLEVGPGEIRLLGTDGQVQASVASGVRPRILDYREE